MSEAGDVLHPQTALTRGFQELSGRLAAALTRQDVLSLVAGPLAAGVGAASGGVVLPGAGGHAWPAASLAQSQPLYLGDVTELIPHVERGGPLPAAGAVLPLALPGEVVGALVFEYSAPRAFTADEKQVLPALAAQVALALQRAALIERQQGELAALRASEAQLRARIEASPVGAPDGAPTAYEQETPGSAGERLPLGVALIRQGDRQGPGHVQALRAPSQAQPVAGRAAAPAVEQTALEQTALEQTALEQTALEQTALEQTALGQTALGQFMRFTEAAAQTTDAGELARLALDTLQDLIPGANVVFVERTPTRWALRHWTDNLDPELLQVARTEGFPLSGPFSAELLHTGLPSFTDDWDETVEGVAHTSQFRAAAHHPVLRAGEVVAAIALAVPGQRAWTPVQRALVRSVGRSFTLMYDRVSVAEQASMEQAEAEQRARALEAFELLSRDLLQETDRYALIGRAQVIVLSLLPAGFAVYYELQDDLWRARAQTGGPRSDALQALLDAGLPYAAPSAHTPWTTGEALYQDTYAQGSDTPAELSQTVQATVSVPLRLQGHRVGIFSVGLFEQRRWTAVDRTVMSTAIHSLELALDRAARTEQLKLQKEEAERRSQVLETFAALMAELNVRQQPYDLIRQVLEVVLSILPDGHALYWEAQDGRWHLRAQAGEVNPAGLQLALAAGLPVGQMPVLDQPWTSGEPAYSDHFGAGPALPSELLADIRAVAAIPVFQGDTLRGVLTFNLLDAHSWRAVDHVMLETVQQSLSLALDRLHQQQVLQQEQAALQAFVNFTTTVASSTDLGVLARVAANTVRDVMDDAVGGFYSVRGDRAYPLYLSDNTPASLVAARQAGVPLQVPALALALQQGGTVFSSADLAQEYSHGYANALSTRFFWRGGEPYALFATATPRPRWTERERAITESVGQGLELAIERAGAAEQLQRQRDEAQGRARALEAFAALSQDLTGQTDRLALLQRALDLTRSLLTPADAQYWEQLNGRWTLRSQAGEVAGDAEVLPWDVPALDAAWTTGEPGYRDAADPDVNLEAQDRAAQNPAAHNPAALRPLALAFLRVQVHAEPAGVLTLRLRRQRAWTALDRATLDTASHSLGLVLERARGLAALEQSNRELHASNEELEAFTYSASHDLRTPVRHVMGFAELAQTAHRKGQAETVNQHLEVIKQAATRMTALIDGMLVLSRSGRQDLKLQPVALGDLVRQAQRDVEAEFGGRPVHWDIGALPRVQGDRGMLQQVLTNLISNAVKYSGKQEVSRVRVWSEDTGTEWTVHVHDNGVGFNPAYAQRLFGLFQRLHTEREFQGTGAGLATVRRIVLKHGGRVFAESPDDAGATFSFTLPKGR